MPTLPRQLPGESVVIRKLYKRDLQHLYDLESDIDVKRYVGGPVAKSRDEWVAGVTRLLKSRDAILPLIIISKSTKEFIGRASLSAKDEQGKRYEVQVLIAKQFWGKKLGREVVRLLVDVALNQLHACAVVAVVHPENRASRALCEALGFKHVDAQQSGRWDNGHLIFELSTH